MTWFLCWAALSQSGGLMRLTLNTGFGPRPFRLPEGLP